MRRPENSAFRSQQKDISGGRGVASSLPLSSVTSSELMATITGKGVGSPPHDLRALGARRNGELEEPDDLLFTPSNKETERELSEVENIAPNLGNLYTLDNYPPVQKANKLQTVHELDGEASHEYKTLVSCERELQDLASLRLKTLEQII